MKFAAKMVKRKKAELAAKRGKKASNEYHQPEWLHQPYVIKEGN
jgi:hypothetical protein